MAIVRRWDPVRDLAGIQEEMNRLFGRTFGEGTESTSHGAWAPAIDVRESSEKFTITVELPGMNSGDIDITVDDGVLTLSGERKFYSEGDEGDFHRIERRYGSFQRRISLPQSCDPTNVQAEMANGLLNIDVAKKELAKPRRVEVKGT